MSRSSAILLAACFSVAPGLGQVPGPLAAPAYREPGRPILTPGVGFQGPTTPVVRPGYFDSLEAIAHFTRRDGPILWRESSADFKLGVLAYHRSGIREVQFSADAGPWTPVAACTTSDQTDHYEYGADLRCSEFTPGWHEVRARVIPESGTDLGGIDRILSFRFYAGHGMVEGVDYERRWVHATLGSDSWPGTRAHPFRTLAHALGQIGSGPTGGNGAVVHLMETDTVVPVGGHFQQIRNELPLTITPEPGARPWFAPGSNGMPEPLPVDHLVLSQLHLDISWNEMFRSGAARAESTLAFEDCQFEGLTHPRPAQVPTAPRVLRLFPSGDYADGQAISIENCTMSDINGSCHAHVGWMRGVTIRNGLVGGFGGSRCLIDCTVVGSPETQYVTSSGLLLSGPGTLENVLYDSVVVLDHSGILLDVRQSFDGLAIVNCTLEGTNGFYFSENLVGSIFHGTQTHLLIEHCTSPQRITLAYPQNWLFEHMFGGQIARSLFGDVYDSVLGSAPSAANVGGNPAFLGLSGLPVDGIHLQPRFQHVHANVPAWSAWTQDTYQDTYVGLATNDLRVKGTCSGSLAVPEAAVGVRYDSRGHRRGSLLGATTPGSLCGIVE